jgi:hypothetical protein
MNVNPVTTPEKMEALRLRLDTLRDELSVFSAAADDDRMNRTAEFEVALFNTFHKVSWHASDLLRDRTQSTPTTLPRRCTSKL